MTRRNGKVRVIPFVVGIAILAFGLAAMAQAPPGAKDVAKIQSTPRDETKQIVSITTLDGVDLVGTFYKGTRGKESPCAILLHRYKVDRSKGEWDALARYLQREKGFAVLTFDFRGHGESKNVSPAFWKYAVNKDLITAGRDKTKISVSEFKPQYLPWLVNDILSARKFLEVKNDSGELNVNSLFLIGAQEGASLGMLFVATEWARTYNVGFKALKTQGTLHLGGEDIAGCVWLSLDQRPNNINFEMTNWLKNPTIRDKTPMMLLYGERDKSASQSADNVLRALTSGKEKNKLDQKFDVKGTELAGQALLSQPALGVNGKISEFIDKVLTERKAIPWSSVSHDENPVAGIALRPFGFSRMP